MATVVRRNERSWAIDLISKINLIAKNNDPVGVKNMRRIIRRNGWKEV